MLTEIRASNENIEPWTVDGNRKNQNSADYENAINETGYGLFNILIFLAALPVAWTCVLDTTITAFLIHSTECDFELTLFRRGIAVGIVYIGMTIAGPLWDFIFQDCIIGHYGKRNVMIIGLILDSICNIFWAHTTSFYTFILLKFFNGMLIAGPLSVLMPYLSEFHAPTYQLTFTKWANLLFVISNIFPPALGSLLILHKSWFHITLYNQFYETWRLYMLICTIPSLIGILTLCLLPKSPKFLLTKGESHEALRVFKIMYTLNKFDLPSKFKITKLITQQKMKNNIQDICSNKLRDNITNFKALLLKPHLNTFLIILTLQFTSMLGFNTMRLWVPQLFTMLNNFNDHILKYYPADEYITMCEMLFPRIQKIDYTSCDYTLAETESGVYFNSMIIASSAVFFSFLFTLMANSRMKKIIVIILSFFLSTIASFGSNWVQEIPYMLILLACVIVTSRMAGNVIITYSTEVIPPNLRPTAINSMNFIGNVGAAIGAIVFPTILGATCLTALMEFGSLMLFCYILSFFLLTKSTTTREESKVEKF